jgi:hypothetical protein
MIKAKKGDRVIVHFSEFLEDGTINNSTLDNGPVKIVLGKAMIVKGFDDAVTGMTAGEENRRMHTAIEGIIWFIKLINLTFQRELYVKQAQK